MIRLVGGRLVRLAVVLLAVSLGTFLLLELLPGDQATAIASSRSPLSLTPQTIDEIRTELRLDDPLPVRYVRWLGGVVRGDLGTSYETGEPVADLVRARMGVTIEIGLLSVVVALFIAVPLGLLLGYRANSRIDKLGTTMTFGLLAVPEFLLAILLVYVFSVRFSLFPTFGWTPLNEGVLAHVHCLVLPVAALTVGQCVIYARLLRSDVIATLQEDFILAARAKGLPARVILLRHALRPSLATVMTSAALQLAAVIGGAAVIETVFALPGVGRLLVDAVDQRDLFVVQALVLLFACAFVVVNTAVDVLHAALDPRVRDGRTR